MTGKTSMTKWNRETIVGALREQVLSGELRPGDKLPSERQLAQGFGVSRPVIREVLRSLADQGLVQILPGKGAYVRPASEGDVAQVFEVALHRNQVTPQQLIEARKMLECEAAYLAAMRATNEDLHPLRLALAQLETAGNVLEQVKWDLAFHLGVVRAAHNPVIEMMFGSIRSFTVEMMLRSLSDPAVAGEGLGLHHEVLRALDAKSPVAAREAMAKHLAVAEQRYGEDLDRPLSALATRELGRLFGAHVSLEQLIRVTAPPVDATGQDT